MTGKESGHVMVDLAEITAATSLNGRSTDTESKLTEEVKEETPSVSPQVLSPVHSKANSLPHSPITVSIL